MRLFLLRHATRSHGIGDAPLNDVGKNQAFELSQNPKLFGVNRILCSPKKRAQMTISPLAQELQCTIETMNELDQQLNTENQAEFNNRVKSFLNSLQEDETLDTILICSHSDWLTVAAVILENNTNFFGHLFQCAEFIAFDLKDGQWIRVQSL